MDMPEPHNHFLCTKCGRLLDLDLDMKNIEEVNRLAAENFDGHNRIQYNIILW